MKYVIRAIKYFVYISVIVALVITILAYAGILSKDVNEIFINGWNSVAMIEGVFLAISFLYPRIGYTRREARINGSFSEIRSGIISYMDGKGYKLESQEGENLTFRNYSPFFKLLRTWEDRLTFERTLGGYNIEGLSKDVARVISGLEYKFRNPDED